MLSQTPITRIVYDKIWQMSMQIWVDGAFNHKTKEAGLGILIREIIPNGTKETRLHVKTKAEDNNQAELLAIYNALQHIKGSPVASLFLLSQTAKLLLRVYCTRKPRKTNIERLQNE